MSQGSASDRPWFWPFMTFLIAMIMVVSTQDAYHTGFAKGVKQERDAKEDHDKLMRGMGVCKWSEFMAQTIQCKRPDPSP